MAIKHLFCVYFGYEGANSFISRLADVVVRDTGLEVPSIQQVSFPSPAFIVSPPPTSIVSLPLLL